MPLSDHEQRLLEQMERALAAEDPKLASALQGVDLRNRQRRRVILGVGVFILGIAMLLGGAFMMTSGSSVVVFAIVSVLGFLVMLLAAYNVATSLRRMPAAGEVPNVVPLRKGRGRGRKGRDHGGEGFMARLEERWRRRRESGF